MVDFKWWQKAVFYQIYLRSFADGNDDGIGDFRGMIHRLDYLKELGIDAIWLSPHYPSPQYDVGYDVADYTGVAPEYGTLADFKEFLDDAHHRNIRVILDLVLNHTSDQHPWFIESRSRRDNPKRDRYIWRDGETAVHPIIGIPVLAVLPGSMTLKPGSITTTISLKSNPTSTGTIPRSSGPCGLLCASGSIWGWTVSAWTQLARSLSIPC